MILDEFTVAGLCYLCVVGIFLKAVPQESENSGGSGSRWSRLRLLLIGCGVLWVGKWVVIDRVGLDKNHYTLLGVQRTASSVELKKGYKAMAREYHPDKVQGTERMETAEEKFSELTHVSEILQDDAKRDIYTASAMTPRT